MDCACHNFPEYIQIAHPKRANDCKPASRPLIRELANHDLENLLDEWGLNLRMITHLKKKIPL
jgi:hypothetical protein